MIMSPRELPITALEDLLLFGARGVHASGAGFCSEPPPRYAAVPERRALALSSLLQCANELLRRQELMRLMARTPLTSPTAVKDYLQTHFRLHEAEAFVVVFVDARHSVIAVEELFRGTLTQTSVYPREIVRRALAHNAGAVILAHNHPSGCAEPSRPDEYLTTTLKSALALVDCRVLDHFVIAGDATTSFAERGLL